MDRRASRNDYAPSWEDNEISLIPADDVSPSSYTDSQAADIPLPAMKKDKRASTAGQRVSTNGNGKRTSTTLNAQKFVPLSMRALYYSVEPTTDSSMEPIPDGPASPKPRRFSNPGTQLVLDPNFPTPQPSPQEYLLKVQTAAFCHDEIRLSTALNPPKTTPQIPLHSICGTVISTPTQDLERPEGSKFKIGDTVWGVTSYTRDGGAADYAVATESELALKPANIGAQEAAALALPGLTAWQALFRHAEIDPDTSVNGNGNGKGKESENGHEHPNGGGQRRESGWGNGNGNGNGGGNGQNMFRTNIFGENNRFDNGRGHANGNRNGYAPKQSIFANGYGNGRSNGNGHSWIRKSVDGLNNLVRTASAITGGSGNGNGSQTENANGNGYEYGYGRRRTSWRRGSVLRRRRRGSQMQLRVLITNARDSEVGRIAVQLLRAEKLFTFPERPWICVTCTPVEADIVRGAWDVDEVIVLPNVTESADECDFGKIFRSQRWGPVDVVLDCSGGIVFRQTHSPAVVKDGGAVLTAVDPWPAQEAAVSDPLDTLGRRKRGLKTMFVPVNPDADSLARIVELVESNMVRGRPEQVTDLIHADRLLKDHAVSAGAARRGVMMVVRVN